MTQLRVSAVPGAKYYTVYRSTPRPDRVWRKVVDIKECAGSKGGRYWGLTLECGHYLSHARPPFRRGVLNFKPQFAPKKKLCSICKADGVWERIAHIKVPKKRAARRQPSSSR